MRNWEFDDPKSGGGVVLKCLLDFSGFRSDGRNFSKILFETLILGEFGCETYFFRKLVLTNYKFTLNRCFRFVVLALFSQTAQSTSHVNTAC